MSSPKSENINDKPKAKNWLQNNKEKSQLFIKIIETLNAQYLGNSQGYVDFKRPQYRYNNKKLGDYTIVTVKKGGSVEIKLFLSNGWKKFLISDFDELDSILKFMEKHQFKSFDFAKQNYNKEFEREVEQSLNSTAVERQKRLLSAPKIPSKIETKITDFKRNPDVVAEVLIRAKGSCESCLEPAPFVRRDGRPYLEVHHKVFLSNGGEDTVENAEAICPNCHRQKHFG